MNCFLSFPSDIFSFHFSNGYRKQDLWRAASRGDLTTCEAILALPLARKFDVNYCEPLTKTTALHVACTFAILSL